MIHDIFLSVYLYGVMGFAAYAAIYMAYFLTVNMEDIKKKNLKIAKDKWIYADSVRSSAAWRNFLVPVGLCAFALLLAVFWPICFLILPARRAGLKQVAAREAEKESYKILASFEDDPRVRKAYLTGDSNVIGLALIEQAKRDAAKENVALAGRKGELDL